MGFRTFQNIILDFLFPKPASVPKLEGLSAGELLQLLPRAESSAPDTLALFSYRHPTVKELVWQVKYSGNRKLALSLASVLFDTIESELMEENIFEKFESVILIPMPVSDQRRFERGWNQAEILAEALLSYDTLKHYKYLPRSLTKVRHTESQTKATDRRARLENLSGSMSVTNANTLVGQCIVLLDDVVTTGATMHEAKRALKEAGAKKIFCLALAH